MQGLQRLSGGQGHLMTMKRIFKWEKTSWSMLRDVHRVEVFFYPPSTVLLWYPVCGIRNTVLTKIRWTWTCRLISSLLTFTRLSIVLLVSLKILLCFSERSSGVSCSHAALLTIASRGLMKLYSLLHKLHLDFLLSEKETTAGCCSFSSASCPRSSPLPNDINTIPFSCRSR